MPHRAGRRALLGLVVTAVALVPACAGARSDGAAPVTELPTMSLDIGNDSFDVLPTATDLIRESYVVARGRFVGGPTVVQTSPEGDEAANSLVVWEFVPDEVYRDVRTGDAPSRVAEEERGSILVADGANEVGRMRGDQPVREFVRTSPSVDNLNSFPVDQPLYVFLRPGSMPRDAVARDADLAHVLTVAEGMHCYAVDALDRSCAYVADAPGGEPEAVLGRRAFVPSGLSPEAIEAAASVTEVVESDYFRTTAPIDLRHFVPVPEGGGDG